tara:strand:+ start:118 stop:1047 length:930 start_codon:yes stop_codon:yes gene_type:complete
MKERIVFMGSDEISSKYLISLIQNNFNIVAVYTYPPKKKGRGMKIKNSLVHSIADKNNIAVYYPTNLNIEEKINEFKVLKPDIAIVMGYGLLIPYDFLKIPKFGFINIHVSLLPRWRGASPIEYSILNGDQKTGITIFQIEKSLDTGPIISSAMINIDKNIFKEDLTNKLNKIGASLLINTLPKIFLNNILLKKQDHSQATYAKKINTEFRKINFNDKVNNVYNHIRAFSPKPSAWFFYKGNRINIIECSMKFCNSKPSTILNDQFHIGCLGGKIIPKIIQREGKKPMVIKEFLKGFKFKINQKVNAKI